MRTVWMLVVLLRAGTVEATTYYVGKSGNNSPNNCSTAQSSAPESRLLTINAGIACMSGGDTLIVGDGIYNEMLGNQASDYLVAIPLGSSWSNMTTLRSENRHGAVLRVRPPNNLGGNSNTLIVFEYLSLTSLFVEMDGFACETELKAFNVYRCIGIVGGQQARFQNFDVNGQIAYTEKSQLLEFLNNDGRNHGFDASGTETCFGGSEPEPGFCHEYYINGGNDIYISGGVLEHMSGACAQLYGSQHTFKDVTCLDQLNAPALYVQQGSGTQVYNNVFYNIGGGPWLKGGGHQVIHNTFILNNNTASRAGSPIDCMHDSGAGNDWKNNLLVDCRGHYTSFELGFDPARVQGNICDASDQGCIATSASCYVASIPGQNFHLCSGSPAISAGVSVSGFSTDKDGVFRPQGGFDAGAYEFLSGSGDTPPGITITSPTSESTFSTSTTPITVGGSAFDDLGIDRVTWACPTCTPTSGTACGGALPACTPTPNTVAWSASIGLGAGENVITVTAHDSASQTASDVITITRPTLPSTPQNARIEQTLVMVTVQVEIAWDHVDEAGDAITTGFQFYRQNNCVGGFVQIGGTLPLSPMTVTDSGLAPVGSYCWHVRAVDAAAQLSPPSNVVRWDAPAPAVVSRAGVATSDPFAVFGVVDTSHPVDRMDPAAQGLLSWWRVLPGLDGGTKLWDLAGTAYADLLNMTPSSGWRPTARLGGQGEILLSAGGNAHLSAGTRTGITGPFGVSFWIKQPVGMTQIDFSGILGQVPSLNWESGWGLYIHNTLLHCFVESYNGNVVESLAPFVPTQWQHVACSWDGVAIRLWVDGVLQGTTGYAGGVTLGSPLDIGLLRDTSATWQGSFDEIKLYTRSLSTSEVQTDRTMSRAGNPGLLRRVSLGPPQLPVVVVTPSVAGDGSRGTAGGMLLQR